MATNVNVYVPNIGEKEQLKAILLQKAMVLGLYKNQIIPDGNTTIDTMEEWPAGGTYAEKPLTNVITESALAADKWFVSTDGSTGKALGAYSNAVLAWAFDAVDAALGLTVYGVRAYSWVLPFDTGSKQIKVGDVVKGVTSLATGIVTGVSVQSGSWAAGTAAGNLDIMTKTGTFQDSENITILGAIATVTVVNDGTGYAVGDILQITQAGGSGCKIVVLTVNAGAITSVGVIDGGTGYSAASALPTTHLTGSGDDAATITIATLATTAYAATNTGSNGDALKKLLAVWALTTGVAIVTAGQQITWDMKYAVASGV